MSALTTNLLSLSRLVGSDANQVDVLAPSTRKTIEIPQSGERRAISILGQAFAFHSAS
jgi:hypothetical protein